MKHQVYYVKGKRVTYIDCLECDNEIECEILSEENGDYTEVPDFCPHCGESTDNGGDQNYREDFHADI